MVALPLYLLNHPNAEMMIYFWRCTTDNSTTIFTVLKLESRWALCSFSHTTTFTFAKSPDGLRKSERGDNSANTFTMNFQSRCSNSHDSDWYQWDQTWLYFTHVFEWRLSGNQTMHFNFILAILWGQKPVWLMCKNYHPLSANHHSRLLSGILSAVKSQVLLSGEALVP